MFINNHKKYIGFFMSKAYKSYSSLYVSGQQGSKVYSVLNPFIDFQERFKNVEKLNESLVKRGMDINTEKLVSIWLQYKSLENTKIHLENKRIEISEKIKSLSDSNDQEITGLKSEGKVIRKDLKNLMKSFWELEETLIPQILALPNDLSSKLYSEETKTFFPTQNEGPNHLKVGKHLELIDYIAPIFYFLKNEAAYFELDMLSHFSQVFKDNEFISMSNPDFSRSIIVEGCALKRDPVALEQHASVPGADNFYLHGTSDLMSFCSFFAKQIVEKVPVKCITQGRQYSKPFSNTDHGLYGVWQNSCVQFFIGTSQSDLPHQLDGVTNLLIETYKKIGLPFQIVTVPAEELHFSESFKLSIQCHSPFLNKYIEVGNISLYNDYLSKRLRMYYNNKDTNSFIHVISGTATKVPPLLASFLENNSHCDLTKIIPKAS